MNPETVICTYRVKKGKELEFENLLKRHEPILQGAELVTEEPFQIYKRTDKKTGLSTYTEIFTWRDEKASAEAHHIPEVNAIWEPMGKLVEERGGEPKWDFAHYQKVNLS